MYFVNHFTRLTLLFIIQVWTVDENGMITNFKSNEKKTTQDLTLPFIFKPNIANVFMNFKRNPLANVHSDFIRFILTVNIR